MAANGVDVCVCSWDKRYSIEYPNSILAIARLQYRKKSWLRRLDKIRFRGLDILGIQLRFDSADDGCQAAETGPRPTEILPSRTVPFSKKYSTFLQQQKPNKMHTNHLQIFPFHPFYFVEFRPGIAF